MRRPSYIPRAVLEDIERRVAKGVDRTLADWELSVAEEDSFTGYLGAGIRTRSRRVRVERDEISGVWAWSLNYRKLRGRGPAADENLIGADGLFELEVRYGKQVEKKSILFQSKFSGEGDPHLLEQCIKLTTWREAAFVMEYSATGVAAIALDDVISSRGKLTGVKSAPLADFLANLFVACHVGDNDLRYFAHAGKLVWNNLQGNPVSIRLPIKHVFRFKVSAPTRRDRYPLHAKELVGAEIYKNRMEVSPEEMLSVGQEQSLPKLKAAMHKAVLLTHPDRYRMLSPELQDILNTRTQEINQAFEKLKRK